MPQSDPPSDPLDSRAGWSADASVCETAAAPPTVGARYERGGLIGRGGMGRVYAVFDRQLGREVALKELDPSLQEDPVATRRLAREASTTARLDHPGIVAVHDIGRLEDGRPFYTMRLVRGRTFARCLAETVGLPARLALVRPLLAACEGVASAHQSGIIHRDLKPTNILVGPFGETQVIDWGLAIPATEAASRWATLPPLDEMPGAVIGTSAYMAPEQARGERPRFHWDVWSLGVILDELLGDAADAPAELRAIVARACAARPSERYPDAGILATDLLSWLEGRRVDAHAYTVAELLRRFLAPYRVPIAVGVLGLAAVGAAIAVGVWQTRSQRDRALSAEATAEAARQDAMALLGQNWVEQAVASAHRGDRARAERRAAAALAIREDPLARGVLAEFGRAPTPTFLGASPGPSCAWSAVMDDAILCGDGRELSRWTTSADRPDWTVPSTAIGGRIYGDRLETWSTDTTIRIVDLATGATLAEGGLRHPWLTRSPPRLLVVDGRFWPDAPIAAACPVLQVLAASPTRVAALCASGVLWTAGLHGEDPRVVSTTARDDHEGASLAVLPDGSVLIGTLRGGVRRIDPATGAVLASVESDLGSVGTLRVSPDGALAAVGGTHGGVRILDLRSGAWLTELPVPAPRSMAFVGDDLVIHAGTRVTRWSLPAGPTARIIDIGTGISDIDARGDVVGVGAGDGRVRVFDANTGVFGASADLAAAVVRTVAFTGDSLVASVMAEPSLFRVPLDGGPLAPLAGDSRLRSLVSTKRGLFGTDLHRGGGWWPRVDGDRVPWAFDGLLSDLERDGDGVIAVAADGRVLAIGDDGEATLFRQAGAVQVAAAGGLVATATRLGIFLTDRQGAVGRLLDAPAGTEDVAFSPDGRRIAAGGLDGQTRVWDVGTGRLLAILDGHSERVSAVSFGDDGAWLATGSWDHTVRIWDLTTLDVPADALRASIERRWGPE